MSKRKAFNFYVSYFDTFNELSDADKLKFITALLNKQFLGIEPELKGISKLAYNSQKHSINQQVEGYENKTKQRLNKGGAIGGAEGGSVQEKGKEKEKEETINERKQSFRQSLSFYNKENPDKYPKQLFIDFEMYWTEHGPKDKKMKFEKQDSFGISQRLSTWFKRDLNGTYKAKVKRLNTFD